MGEAGDYTPIATLLPPECLNDSCIKMSRGVRSDSNHVLSSSHFNRTRWVRSKLCAERGWA